MSKSNFIKNCYNVEDPSIINKESCFRELEIKQCKLKNLVLEKEELQRQLYNAADYIEDNIKKHTTITCQLTNNYDELWSKYQNKIVELNKNKDLKKRLSDKVEDLNRKTKTLECHLKDHNDKNEYLQLDNDKLEKRLNEEKQNIIFLKEQIQNKKKYLDKNDEELNKTTRELEEKTDELKKEKEEHCNLKLKTESLRCELLQKTHDSKSEIFCLTESIKNLKIELERLNVTKTELDQMLCKEQTQREDLIKVLKICEDKNKTLKETTEKEKIKTNEQICRLRTEKNNIQNEMDELKTKIEQLMKEMKKLECTNGSLKTQVDELQCKLDTVVRNSDEKCKSLTEKLECIQENKRKLENDLMCKTETICVLEDKLCQAKQIHKIESENAYNLKIQLENLKYKQIIMPNNKCSKISNIDSNCQLDNKLMDETKSDCESLTSRIKLEKNGISDLEETNKMFENVITKCNMLANYFTK